MSHALVRRLEGKIEQLESEITSLRAQNAAIPALQSQLENLVTIHATSKKERQAIAAELREQRKALTKDLEAKDAQLKEALALNDTQLDRCLDLEESIHSLRQTVEETENQARRSEEDARSLVESMPKAAQLLRQMPTATNKEYELQLALHAADRKARVRAANSDELLQLVVQLEAGRESLQELINQMECDTAQIGRAQTQERSEWQKERSSLIDEIRSERLFASRLQLQLEQSAAQHNEKRMLDRQYVYLLTQMHEFETTKLKNELDSCNDIIPALRKECDDLTINLDDCKESLVTAKARIKTVEAEVNTTKASLTAIQAASTKDKQGQAKDIAKLSSDLAAMSIDKAALEKQLRFEQNERQAFDSQLKAAKTKEVSIKERLKELEAQLQPFEDLQKSHATLQAKVTELSARSQVAEADVRHLNEENANLLGHTNANQKISHLQNLRTELSDIRKKYSVAMAALDALKAENAELNEEIENLQKAPAQASIKGNPLKRSSSMARRRTGVLGTISNLR